MSEYIIEGGKRLEGELRIDGSKNAVLPIIAATLLCGDITYLKNCPKIKDVEIMIEILQQLGCKVKWDTEILVIDTSTLSSVEIDPELAGKMRSSIILLGALIGRCKEAKIVQPGGCKLGARPIDLHLSAFKKIGIQVTEEQEFIICKTSNLQGAEIYLDFPSVGATENIMLAATLTAGKTTIYNAAREPEIVDLQNYLVACGAKIVGAGTRKITIIGVDKLHGATYKVIPDRIIAGTYLVAAAITRGDVILRDVDPNHLRATINKLKTMGCLIGETRTKLHISVPGPLRGACVTTKPYPGFPTDMQSQMMALMCTANSISHIKENLFESRFKIAAQLEKMGAKIHVLDQQATIYPVQTLKGCTVQAEDLRGGAALVLAGLASAGTTIVTDVHHIERGYENIVKDLSYLGAVIQERK